MSIENPFEKKLTPEEQKELEDKIAQKAAQNFLSEEAIKKTETSLGEILTPEEIVAAQEALKKQRERRPEV
jgi:hypothetical protein